MFNTFLSQIWPFMR